MADQDEKNLEKAPRPGDKAQDEQFGEFRGKTVRPTSEQIQTMRKFTLGDDQNPLQIVKPEDDPRKVIAQADRTKQGAVETQEKPEPRELKIRKQLEKLMPPGHAYQIVFKMTPQGVEYTFGHNQKDDKDFQTFQKNLNTKLDSNTWELITQETNAHNGRWVANLHTDARPTQWKAGDQTAQQGHAGAHNQAEAPGVKPETKPHSGSAEKFVDDVLNTDAASTSPEPAKPRPTEWKRDLKAAVEQTQLNTGTQGGSDRQEPSYLYGSGSLSTLDGRSIPIEVTPKGNMPIAFETPKGTRITCRISGYGAVTEVQGHLEIEGDQRYFAVTHYVDRGALVQSPPGRPFAKIALFKCSADGSLKY